MFLDGLYLRDSEVDCSPISPVYIADSLSLLPPFLWADVHHYIHSSETDDILQKHAFIPSLTYNTVLMAVSTWHLHKEQCWF